MDGLVSAAVETNNINIVAWNPNGIRALFKNRSDEVQRLVKEYKPHIIIWNEIKGNESKQDEIQKQVDKVMPGFKWYWNHSDKAGRHGICIAIDPKIKVLSVDYGLNGTKKEPEGRIITLELEKCYVVGLYVVNAGMKGCDRLKYKLDWMVQLAEHLQNLVSSSPTPKPVVAMGDWNIAPTDLDIHNPKTNAKSAGFTPEEKECFSLFKQIGWIDVYRHKYPDRRIFSFWNTKFRAREKDAGWRIDHCMVNEDSIGLLENAKCEILDNYLGSDHAPIYFSFSL